MVIFLSLCEKSLLTSHFKVICIHGDKENYSSAAVDIFEISIFKIFFFTVSPVLLFIVFQTALYIHKTCIP